MIQILEHAMCFELTKPVIDLRVNLANHFFTEGTQTDVVKPMVNMPAMKAQYQYVNNCLVNDRNYYAKNGY